jgi:hypothetical protein
MVLMASGTHPSFTNAWFHEVFFSLHGIHILGRKFEVFRGRRWAVDLSTSSSGDSATWATDQSQGSIYKGWCTLSLSTNSRIICRYGMELQMEAGARVLKVGEEEGAIVIRQRRYKFLYPGRKMLQYYTWMACWFYGGGIIMQSCR